MPAASRELRALRAALRLMPRRFAASSASSTGIDGSIDSRRAAAASLRNRPAVCHRAEIASTRRADVAAAWAASWQALLKALSHERRAVERARASFLSHSTDCAAWSAS